MAKDFKACYLCGKLATLLCDGRKEVGTCDRPMCDRHVAKQSTYLACSRGKGIRRHSSVHTVDYCSDCAQEISAEILVEQALQQGGARNDPA